MNTSQEASPLVQDEEQPGRSHQDRLAFQDGGAVAPALEEQSGLALDASAALQQRIPQYWAHLSASERKLARVLMQPGFSLAGFQAAELAALAEVSRACTARFFQKVGYESFNQARRLERDLAGNSPLARSAADLQSGQAGLGDDQRCAQAWRAHADSQQQQLESLHQAITPGQVAAAVSLLFGAPRVYVLGLRASHVPACYAQALWLQLRHDVLLLGDSAGRPSELLSQVRPGDLLVVVDFRRRASQLLPLMRAAAQRQVRQLLITDTPMSDLVTLAEVSLCCPNARHHIFDSHIGAFSLIHFLAGELAARHPEPVRQRLAEIETLHELLADIEVPAGAARGQSKTLS